MSLPPRTVTGIMSVARCVFLLLAVAFLPGGCPAGGGASTTGVTGTDVAGDSSNVGTGADTVDAGSDGISGENDDTGDTTDDGTGDTTDDSTDGVTDDGFTTATVIHRAAGGFPADPKFGIPDASYFNVSDGGIQTSVQIPHVSKDGGRIWFAAQDGNGFVEPQLFCINTDGSGLQEIALPADLNRMPVELWPSADGQVCALIINTGTGTDFSQTTVRIADRRTGEITMLLDGRLIGDGNDDFDNVQITDDGATVYFKDSLQHIIYSVPASGGSLSAVSVLGDYAKAGCTPREILKFRINGDASALLANIWFYGPSSTYPADIYLKTPLGVMPVTSTGDAPQSYIDAEYLGVSDDSRYVLYRRFFSSESRYGAYVLDCDSGLATELPTGASNYATILDSAGTAVYTGWATGRYYGGIDQLGGLGTLNACGRLEVLDGWVGVGALTSMSAGADVLVGTWFNGAFGDPTRLYAWFANAASYRDGPSITGVCYKLDATAGTLTVRATVAGTATEIDFQALYQNVESFYQLEDDQNPFYNERWGPS